MRRAYVWLFLGLALLSFWLCFMVVMIGLSGYLAFLLALHCLATLVYLLWQVSKHGIKP